MISVLHTWGRILTVAGGLLSILLAVPAQRASQALADVSETRECLAEMGRIPSRDPLRKFGCHTNPSDCGSGPSALLAFSSSSGLPSTGYPAFHLIYWDISCENSTLTHPRRSSQYPHRTIAAAVPPITPARALVPGYTFRMPRPPEEGPHRPVEQSQARIATCSTAVHARAGPKRDLRLGESQAPLPRGDYLPE